LQLLKRYPGEQGRIKAQIDDHLRPLTWLCILSARTCAVAT
jgi:hypothetical protein